MNEDQVKQLNNDIYITETLATLAASFKAQNDVLLVILHNLDLKMPDWKTREDIQKDVGQKLEDCLSTLKEVYGRSETDKS